MKDGMKTWLLLGLGVLVRLAIGFHPYSGESMAVMPRACFEYYSTLLEDPEPLLIISNE